MTGQELYRAVVRRGDPITEADLAERYHATRAWASILGSPAIAARFLDALEANPKVLDLDVGEFARWLTNVPGIGHGKAGFIVAALYGSAYVAGVDAAPAGGTEPQV